LSPIGFFALSIPFYPFILLFQGLTEESSYLIPGIISVIIEIILLIILIPLFITKGIPKIRQFFEKRELDKKRKEIEYNRALERWGNAMKRWEHLYYCYRDDCVFIIGENKPIPVNARIYLSGVNKYERKA